MAATTFRYVFPWAQRGAAGNEGFDLLDGAVRASVRYNATATPERRYTALIEPGLHLGEFATKEEARAAVERRVTQKINEMLGVVLPNEVKQWLMRD